MAEVTRITRAETQVPQVGNIQGLSPKEHYERIDSLNDAALDVGKLACGVDDCRLRIFDRNRTNHIIFTAECEKFECTGEGVAVTIDTVDRDFPAEER